MENKSVNLIDRKNLLPFILVTALFFFWGLPNSLNDILIKQFMKSLELNPFKASLIQSAFYMGYFLLAIPAALIMKKFNYKTGLIIGLLLFSCGSFLFYPAAQANTFSFFLFALFVIASGLAFLETGANPFIAEFGDPSASAQRLNLSQAFNPFGIITGATIGTLFIFSGIEPSGETIEFMKKAKVYDVFLHQETLRVVKPYMGIGAVVLIWAFLMVFVKFPKLRSELKTAGSASSRYRDLLKYPHFIKSVMAQFFYVGAQVGTWSFFIRYMQAYTNSGEKIAGSFLIGTFTMFTIGRFSATYLMKFFKPNILMGYYALINIFLVVIGILLPGWIGMAALFLTSFFMSLMFPTIFALGLNGLGEKTKLGGSLIVMAIIGGAVFPPLMGLIMVLTKSIALSYIIPVISYIFISLYSFRGSVPKEIVS